jgi:hypothetical protein
LELSAFGDLIGREQGDAGAHHREVTASTIT